MAKKSHSFFKVNSPVLVQQLLWEGQIFTITNIIRNDTMYSCNYISFIVHTRHGLDWFRINTDDTGTGLK